jgi:hypothetical protein
LYVPDGIVDVDSPLASRWGFCSWAFSRDSYLWVNRSRRRVMVSLLIARQPGRGAFSRMVRCIEADGFRVAVPCPLRQMTAILLRWGFRPHWEESELQGVVDVWERPR